MSTDSINQPTLEEIVADLERRTKLSHEAILQKAKEELARQKALQAILDAERPLIQALSEFDIDIQSLQELATVDSKLFSDRVIQLLMNGVSGESHPLTKYKLIRALGGIKGNAIIPSFFIAEVRKPHEDRVVSGLLEGIKRTASRSEIPELQELLLTGPVSKWGAISAIARLMKSDSIPLLMPFLDDPLLANMGAAIDSLGRLRAREATFKIKQLTKHEDSYIREKARRALKKLT